MSDDLKDLVSKFIQGDHAAFTELVGRFKKKVYSVAYQMLGNHLDADEVTQETFVRIYNRRKQLKDVNYFASFLMRIATNYSIDLIRKRQKRYVSVEDESQTQTSTSVELSEKIDRPDQIYEKREILRKIKQTIEQLPPKQRVTVILHDVEGFSKAEVAQILGCPQATVRSNLHIARTKLRKWLGPEM
jgi:RNA polymerase sigma-70 factor (ECF subfamily)